MNSNLRENAILGIGHPLLDLIVKVDEEFLKKYKLRKNKTIAATEEHETLFKEIIENHNPIYLVGGCVHNTLFVMQWIIKKRNVATFVGCVGYDKYADIVEEKARKVGIDVRFEKIESISTSSCAVLITGTDRTLVTRIEKTANFSKEHVKQIWPCIEKAQFFYIMGFSLPMNFDVTMKVARHSNENNKTFIMNLSAEYICEHYTKEFMQLFPYIDIIFGNELELLAFARALGIKANNFKDKCLEISKLPKKNKKINRACIITRSDKPVICASGGEVKEFPVIWISPEKIVDSNGAGDAFVGGFLAQFITGKSLVDSIKCGQRAASASLQHVGCNFEDEDNFIDE